MNPAGLLQLNPGGGRPAIVSTRPVGVASIAAGRLAATLPQLLGAVYTLCAMPHRQAAAAAVAAALGRPVPPTPAERSALRASQAREQILRIGHDWPQRWPGVDPVQRSADQDHATRLLRSCPLWQADRSAADQLALLPDWIAARWTGIPVAAWLAEHDADPQGWAARWCAAASGPLARQLRTMRPLAQQLTTPSAPLRLLDDAAQHMPVLARLMAGTPDFCAQPRWAGLPADTGPWSRHHSGDQAPADTVWRRLVSRVVDVLQLAAPHGEHWLAQGAMNLGPRRGIAWVEMARGLLVHHVELDSDADLHGARVRACQVLAPTEWNFHPQGGLALALSGLCGDSAADEAGALALAYDPCVDIRVNSPTTEACDA